MSERVSIELDRVESQQAIITLNKCQADAVLQKQSWFYEQDRRIEDDIQDSRVPKDINDFLKWQMDGDQGDCHRLQFRSGVQGQDIRSRFEQIVKESFSSNWLIDCAVALSGELFMNANLDAPRHSSVGEGESAELIVAITQNTLYLVCSDNYGSLDTSTFFTRLEEVYTQGAGKVIRMHEPGAGIGCQIIFENCSTLMQFVWKNSRTFVLAKLPLNVAYRRFSESPKNIIIYNSN